MRLLSYWQQTGVFTPSWIDDTKLLNYKYLYSFRDLVAVRTLKILHDRGVSSADLRKTAEHIRLHAQDPWSSLRFYVAGTDVYFDDPEGEHRYHGPRIGQQAFPFDMEKVVQEMRQRTGEARQRDPRTIGEIVARKRDATIAGTRIPTAAIWDWLASGATTEQILEAYPGLEPADIEAARRYEQERHTKRLA